MNKQKPQFKYIHSLRNGQALLIVVVFMGAIMLGLSVISGLLFTQRLRTSVDISKSAKAIFAADAGIEKQLDAIFAAAFDGSLDESTPAIGGGSVSGGATYTLTMRYDSVIHGFVITSTGNFKDSRSDVSRQLELELHNLFAGEEEAD